MTIPALEKISAHTSSIRHAVFLHNSRIVSVSDDLTMRVWDRTSGQVIYKILILISLLTDMQPNALGPET